ncbi:transcriptional regulator [Salmonella enterica subsp. diarizonae serovar 61:z52:z53]|nr:transcriptional regulator [Salmonella enterica subsp. diarizonae serovar 61:z52:z53]
MDRCNSSAIDVLHADKLMYPGEVSPEHFKCLINLSKIHGKKATMALESFLVKGWSRKDVFKTYIISPGYFSLKLNQLRQCNIMIAEILPFYIRSIVIK